MLLNESCKPEIRNNCNYSTHRCGKNRHVNVEIKNNVMQVQGKYPFTMQRNTIILEKQVFRPIKKEAGILFLLEANKFGPQFARLKE